jgi:transcriptional regulator of aromatic amino acid metabolism
MTAAQNEELRTINDDLERMVAERTESLEMQNQALQLSHAILEDLPFPIVGIGNDKMIALINKMAQHHFCEHQPLLVGEYISDYLQGMTDPLFQDLLASSRPRHLACQGKHSGRAYELDFHPLTGRFSNNGLIITVHRCPFSAKL